MLRRPLNIEGKKVILVCIKITVSTTYLVSSSRSMYYKVLRSHGVFKPADHVVWKNVFGLYASTSKNHRFDLDIKGSSYTRVALYASIYGNENLL